MKNLFGAVAPTLSIFRSFKVLMLLLLVTIGFASCENQSKLEILPQTDLTAKNDLPDVQTDFDIGGRNDTSTGNYTINDVGDKSISPTLENRPVMSIGSYNDIECDTEYVIAEIGGRDSSGGLGSLSFLEIGGRGGTGTGLIDFSLSSIRSIQILHFS